MRFICAEFPKNLNRELRSEISGHATLNGCCDRSRQFILNGEYLTDYR